MSITPSPNAVGTLRWTAPEILDPESFGLEHAVATLETDVYSFGMVMWEVSITALSYPTDDRLIGSTDILRSHAVRRVPLRRDRAVENPLWRAPGASPPRDRDGPLRPRLGPHTALLAC